MGLLASLVLYLVIFAGVPEGFSQQKQPPAAGEHLLGELKLIKEKWKVLAPDFTLSDLDWEPVRLGDLKGKVVFLNFWATWCPPCIKEMPTMERLHQEFGNKGLVILAIDKKEGFKSVKAFAQSHKFTFKILLDIKGTVSSLYHAWALPITVIVNKRGEKMYTAIGYREWNTPVAKEFFHQMLKEK